MHKIATNVTIVTRLNIYEAYNTMSISEKKLERTAIATVSSLRTL